MFLIPETHWEVKKTRHKGKGVFARHDIMPGVVVGDYLGKIIHTKEEDDYEKKFGFYNMYYHRDASIFPNLKKPGIHLFNHSCTPNCWMYTYKGHVLYFTVRKVFKEEELTISYLLGPQDETCSPCTDACRCESVTCTNTLHISQKKYDAWVAFDNIQTQKTKREYIKIGDQLQRLDDYPISIPDAPIYTLFGASTKPAIVYHDRSMPPTKELRSRIRTSGRMLQFPYLNVTVLGIEENLVVTEPIKN